MPRPSDILHLPVQTLAEWFSGKTIAELEAIEEGRRIFIPEALRTRGANGELRLTPVVIRLPTDADRENARVAAIMHVAEKHPKLMGRDGTQWTVTRCREVVGPEVFEDIDTYAIVAEVLRDAKDRNVPFLLLPLLRESFPKNCIADIYERIERYVDLFDPRVGEMTDELFTIVLEAIHRVRDLSPLAVMDGATQRAFLLRLVSECSSSRSSSSS